MEFSIFLIGLILGSFLNMLIYRLPLGISLINPKRSTCTTCKHQIKWYENIPVLSYLYLKGKCSSCDSKISITYPIVELITAFVTISLFYKIGWNIDFAIFLILFSTLIVLSFIDFKFKAVPDYLLIILLIVGMVSSNFSFYNALLFAGGFVILEIFVTFYIQNIKSRILKDEDLLNQKALGEGDIPIVTIIGGLLGLKLGLVAVFAASIFAIIPSLLNTIIKKDIETPFIPYLSLGLFIVYLFQSYFLELLGKII